MRAQVGAGEAVRQFAGCLLRDVLNAAKLAEGDRHDLRRTIVVATASDGYKAVFSWGELFNSTIGDGVLVVYERDGAPLGDDEGRIALDLAQGHAARSAPRQVAGKDRSGSRAGVTGLRAMAMGRTTICRAFQCWMGRMAMVTMTTVGMMGAPDAAGAAPERLFAAGSLRDAFIVLIAAYREDSGIQFEALYGPSGKLREQIQRGDVPAVFASASIEHTDALVKSGLLGQSIVLARNRLCVLAAPGVTLDANRLLDTLLDPAIRVGTSTPGADPSGDYTWEFFRKAGKVRPGAFAALDAKALKLTGRDVDPQQQDSPYANVLLKDRAADVFITYCTNATAAARREPRLTWVRIPDELNVGAVYGIGAATTASAGGAGFVQFALSPRGRAVLEGFGFDGP